MKNRMTVVALIAAILVGGCVDSRDKSGADLKKALDGKCTRMLTPEEIRRGVPCK